MLLPSRFQENHRSQDLPTVIAFSSVNTPIGRFKPYRMIQEANVNTIFVSDSGNNWYQKGIEGVSNDSATAAKDLITRARRIGNGQTFTFGTSMGAFGAALFASLGGADGALGFGVENPIGLPHSRSVLHMPKATDPLPYKDLREVICVPTTFFTCEADEVDLISSLNLNHPDVMIFSMLGAEHPGIQYFDHGGYASRIIDFFCNTGNPIAPPERRGTILNEPDLIRLLYKAYCLKLDDRSKWRQVLEDGAKTYRHALLYTRLGEARRLDGDLSGARSAWEEAAKINPYEHIALQKLGSLPDTPPQMAVSMLQHSVFLAPDNAHSYFGLGRVYEKLGRDDMAERNYRLAVKINGGNPTFRQHLGELLLRAAASKADEGKRLLAKNTVKESERS